MKYSSRLLAAAGTFATVAVAGAPNIVVILADDMGYSDVGCFGSEISTPNLDRLAKEGVRFTQFYNAGRCCPSRASLLTGRYSHRVGVGHMTGDLGDPAYRGFLSPGSLTIAEALKQAGYRSYMVGKWHLGDGPGRWPTDHGFDRFYGSPTSPGNYFRNEAGRPPLQLDGRPVSTGEDWYATDAFTDHAIQFIQEHRSATPGKPFFLYVAYTAPHWPLHAKPADIAKYRGKYRAGWDNLRRERYERMLALGILPRGTTLPPRDDASIPWTDEPRQDEMELRMAIHAAMVDSMDQNIGRLLAVLDKLKVSENTLILFLSDNGASAEGGRSGFDRGQPGAETGTVDSQTSIGLSWANFSDTPFRRFKRFTHEGGIATPLIAHWPAGIPHARHGAIETQPGHVIDILPTVLAAIGQSDVEKTALKTIDGTNLLPALKGEPLPERALFFEHEGNRAVIERGLKLVSQHGESWELYDLDQDRTETSDISATDRSRAAELAERWQTWAVDAGVKPWPVNN